MNIRIRYIIAAVTAIVALFSCAKEPVLPAEEGGTVPQEGVRVISVSFGTPTKSTMGSDFKPEFKDGDWIKLSNTTAWEDCQVRVSGGKATIETTLTGELKAVYPRAAALTDATTGIITGDGFKVLRNQSGKFSDANICMATIGASASKAVFYNKTAILRFYVDKSIGVKSISVESTTSLSYITGDTSGSGNYYLDVNPGSGTLIHTVTEEPDTRICYVSIFPGTRTLKFSIQTSSQGYVNREMSSAVEFVANGIYNVSIPYYIKVKVSDTPEVYQYWGYCNVGAFLPEEAGRYFAWGDTAGQTWNGSAWSGGGFQAQPSIGNPPVLPLEYDAAYIKLGGGWRIATNDDFETLCNACGGVGTMTDGTIDSSAKDIYSCSDYYGVPGALFCDGTNKLFLPAAGVGKKASPFMYELNTGGLYLSSTIQSGTTNGFLRLDFDISGSIKVSESSNRGDGFPIRPIYLPPVSSKFETYNDGDIIL